jgi:hypothetical protein
MKASTKFWEGASRRTRALLLAGALLVTVPPGAALAEGSTAANAGMGAASALCSLVYGPAKVVYATLGLVMGGMAWGLSGGDSDVMDAVLLPAVRGDYVVTPANLRGERELEFIGHRPGYGPDAVAFEEDY